MIDSVEAVDALATIRASRIQLVTASDTPPLRHLAFAGLMGTLVACPAVMLPWRFGVLFGILIGIALVVRWDRRRTGMFINGYRAGRTRKVTFAMLAFSLGLYAISVWLADGRHMIWPSLVLGCVATVACWFGSRYWCSVFEREMTGEA
ncbi:hypothetical protein [uncultured Sphingomonas sp.]|uniref:hypothetical protein n=1 Tax=uncultured Sphingomonas sp. TaxID=158754 RepID=UPI0035CBE574